MPKPFLLLCLLLSTTLLATPGSALAPIPDGCDPDYKIPDPIQAILHEQELRGEISVEIVSTDLQGYIRELFINDKLYLVGLFYYEESTHTMFVCVITSAIQASREGEEAFVWNIAQEDL